VPDGLVGTGRTLAYPKKHVPVAEVVGIEPSDGQNVC
jgi:hypothetical protein